MRTRRPVLLCDGDDGECGSWDVDHWTETCDRVNGVKITSTERAPGWTTSAAGDDLCPDCSERPPVRAVAGVVPVAGVSC